MPAFTTRPVVMSARGVVTSGHYLVSSVGFQMLARGGNAIDAAAAMGICETLLEPQSCGIGGEVPTLVYIAKERRTYSVSGMGWSAEAFTIDWCRQNGIDLIPGDGYLPACVPAVVGTWTTALARWGTMSFAEIVQPTIDLAENGFPVYDGLQPAPHRRLRQVHRAIPHDRRDLLPQRQTRSRPERLSATPTSARCSAPSATPRSKR